MTLERTTYNQGPCQHCGGHYEYHCPTGDGRYEQ